MTAISALSSLGLPGQLLNLLAGAVSHHGSKSASATTNASHAASFSGVLNGQMTNGTDPLAQLAALVNGGTPMSTIVDQLSNQIADAVAKRLPASQLSSGASRTALVSSIKSALSPPSNAPPGTAANQVAALEQRLQRWLEGLSGGADQQVGQQSDISGKILDANSARELPAQTQGSKSTPVATGAASLANSLLKSLAAALTGDPSAPAKSAGTADASALANAATAAATAAATSAATGAPAPAPAPDPSASASTTAQNAATSSSGTPADLVARMIARAAGVDAVHNVNLPTVQSAAPSAQLARGTAGSTGTASPAATAAKMTALLTQAINEAAEGAQQRGAAQDDALRDQDTSSAGSAAPLKTTARTDLSSFSLPTASSPITTAQAQSQATTTANAGPADPAAAIEQLVKSMAMRTGSDGTSEMRLRLQPESLGTVTLKLTVDGNNVSANVVAQNGEARTALLAQQHHLARSLADSGLKLTSFTVDLSGGQAQDQMRDRTSGFGRRYTVHEMAAADGDSAESTSTGPALLPSSTLGLLSYLA